MAKAPNSAEEVVVDDASQSDDEAAQGTTEQAEVDAFFSFAEGEADAEEQVEDAVQAEEEPAAEPTKEAGTEEPKAEEKPEAEPAKDAEKAEPSQPAEEEKKPEAEKTTSEPEEAKATEPKPAVKTREEQLEEYTGWRTSTEETLASGHYKLPDDVAEVLDPEVAPVISKLMAKVYLDAVEGASTAIMQVLPQAISTLREQQSVGDQAETKFYEAWPLLNSAEHGETIRNLSVAYRAAHPNLDSETFIRDVGAQAMVALRIPFEPAAREPDPSPLPQPPVGRGGPGGAKPKPNTGMEAFIEEDLAGEEF